MAKKDESNSDEEPIVRDKRRVDPETGKVRHPAPESGAADDSAPGATGAGNGRAGASASDTSAGAGNSDASAADLEHEQVVDTGEGFEGPDVETSLSDADLDFLSGQTDAEQLAAERLNDLKRVTAEYANYRKRTEANREIERERAVADAVKAIVPVLDDLDRAEKHGDLEADTPFATIAAKLRASAEKLGLRKFGEAGEPFDPQVHDAIFQQPSPDVKVETVADVVEGGYTLGSTLLRPAKVVVAVPA